ncbi:unnamed protein product [Symbiodinium sp. CCMP2456]|nr:unnamed protein product [Symbiodinium sp. CCMP2456]
MACPMFAEVASNLSKRTLLIWGASCRQTLHEAFEASGEAWVSVDLSSWHPGPPGPGKSDDCATDADLEAALGRIPVGRLRRLRLRGKFTDMGLAPILARQAGLQELSLIGPETRKRKLGGSGKEELTGESLLAAKRLRRLEVSGLPSAVAALAGAKRLTPGPFVKLEELVLHSPSESDLQAVPTFTGLKVLEIAPAPLVFDERGHLRPVADHKGLLQILRACRKLESVSLEGTLLHQELIEALLQLPALTEVVGILAQDVNETVVQALLHKCANLALVSLHLQ